MGKINFRIVEVSESDRHYEHLYDSFREDYLDFRCSSKDLKEKYDIPPYLYREWSKKIREEEGLNRKPSTYQFMFSENIHIYKLCEGYGIRKKINGFMEYFGRYKELDTAKMVRDKLIDAKWDKEVAEELIKEYGYIKPSSIDMNELMGKYEEFKHLYLDVPTKYQDILSKLHLNARQYRVLVEMVREEYGRDIKKNKLRCYDGSYSFKKSKNVTPKPDKVKSRPLRYIRKNTRGKYEIIKVIDGKQRYFGCYSNLTSAMNKRCRLERNGWVV